MIIDYFSALSALSAVKKSAVCFNRFLDGVYPFEFLRAGSEQSRMASE
jgi:hypothetical protein